jgi:L-ascorbate metabolism protein UlaG (beta-lactamase superfamily)
MKRKTPLPVDIANIASDYILISHGHYDHLDQRTLAQLQGTSLTALVPLKIGPIVHAANPAIQIQEAGWYQQFKTDDITITLLPAKHWNRRTLFDFNQTLWGSFLIQTKTHTIYFAGDTGYTGHFKEIAALVGPIDYAILPIGAYEPSFIMQPSHLNPEEALQAFEDLGAKHLIPMHYGTFDLSDEPLGEPIQRLNQLLHERHLEPKVIIPDVGDPWYLD